MKAGVLLGCLSFLFLGCASIHSGNMSKDEKGQVLKKGGMSVSGLENNALASTHFLPIDVTVENNTNEWIVITNASVSFGSEEVTSKMLVPVGRDLVTWAEAAQQNAAISAYNTSLLLGAVAAAGAVGTRSGDSGLASASALALAGGGVGLTAVAINDKLGSIEKARVLPDTHLYSGTFAVPPGLHVKRWAVFYVKEPLKIPYQKEMTVNLKTKSGETFSFNVPFRRLLVSSNFQNLHPDNAVKPRK